jgi:hypothetical protein
MVDVRGIFCAQRGSAISVGSALRTEFMRLGEVASLTGRNDALLRDPVIDRRKSKLKQRGKGAVVMR